MSKSRKAQAHDSLLEYFSRNQHLYPEPSELAAHLVEAIEIMIGIKKKGEKTDGSRVWDAYVDAYTQRHGFAPKQSVKKNVAASNLVKELGLEDAIRVVKFFVAQNESFLIRTMHQLEHCRGGELYSKLQSGKTISRKAADKIESVGASLGASQSYLSRKYGQVPHKPKTPEEENK